MRTPLPTTGTGDEELEIGSMLGGRVDIHRLSHAAGPVPLPSDRSDGDAILRIPSAPAWWNKPRENCTGRLSWKQRAPRLHKPAEATLNESSNLARATLNILGVERRRESRAVPWQFEAASVGLPWNP